MTTESKTATTNFKTPKRWLNADQMFTIIPEIAGSWDFNGIRIMATTDEEGNPTILVDDTFKSGNSEIASPKFLRGEEAFEKMEKLLKEGYKEPEAKKTDAEIALEAKNAEMAEMVKKMAEMEKMIAAQNKKAA